MLKKMTRKRANGLLLGAERNLKKRPLAEVEIIVGNKVVHYTVPTEILAELTEYLEPFPHETATLGGSPTPLQQRMPWERTGVRMSAGVTLKQYRKAAKLTQVDLAAKIGSTQANIASAETGNRTIGKEFAEKLGTFFSVDYRVFLDSPAP